ncbi:MAG: MFS transporter [Rhizomicrobium sp.]
MTLESEEEVLAAEVAPKAPREASIGMPSNPTLRILAYVLLLSSSPCATLVFAALAPILPTLAENFGGGTRGPFVAQMMMAMPGLGTIIGGALSGFLLERLGLRRVMLGGLAIYVVTGSAGLYLSDMWPLLISRLLLGLVVATHSTCVMMLLSEWADGGLRAKLLGYTGAVSGIVSVSAINLSGALAHADGWRAPFYIYLLPLVFLLCVALTVRGNQALVGASQAKEKGGLTPLIPLYLLILVLYVAVMMSAIQVPFLLAADGVSEPTTRSFMISLGSIGSMSAGMLFGWIFAFLGRKWIVVLFTGLMSLGFIVAGTVTHIPIVAAACLVFGFGCGMTTPFTGHLILEKAAPAVRGRAVGLVFVIVSVADFLNPAVIAPISAQFGIHGAFLIAGVLLAIASIVRVFMPTPAATEPGPATVAASQH